MAMKTGILLLVCLGAADAASHIDILAALHKGVPQQKFDVLSLFKHKKHKKKSQDPTGILSQIMAASSMGLATAEKAHEKAVNAARDAITVLLNKNGDELSAAVVKYDADLASAKVGLVQAMNASQEALAKAEAAPSKTTGWDSSANLGQAKLSTQISFADRSLRKAERKHAYAVKEATSNADQMLEDAVRTVSRKTGDLTELVKAAQSKIDDAVQNAAAPAAVAPASLAQKSAMDLKSAGDALAKAKTQTDQATAAAKKALDAALAKVEKDLAAGMKAQEDALIKEQQEEIAGVRAINPLASLPVPKKSLRAPAKKP